MYDLVGAPTTDSFFQAKPAGALGWYAQGDMVAEPKGPGSSNYCPNPPPAAHNGKLFAKPFDPLTLFSVGIWFWHSLFKDTPVPETRNPYWSGISLLDGLEICGTLN